MNAGTHDRELNSCVDRALKCKFGLVENEY